MNQKISKIINHTKKVLKDDSTVFRFAVGLKMVGVVTISLILCMAMLFLFIKINLLFFESHGFPKIEVLDEAFYDRALYSLEEYGYIVSIFLIVNFFIGIYVAELMIRPFKSVAVYCESKIINNKLNYTPCFFSDLNLMTSYCDVFFNYIESAELNGKLTPMVIPEKFKNIHRPVFERNFFLQHSLYILITAMCTIVGLYIIFDGVYDNIVTMAINHIGQSQNMKLFLSGQGEFFDYMIAVVMSVHMIISLIMVTNFYSQVSAPAFAIFSTFRTFSKGNYNARIHLIGSYFLRPKCRVINKYLDMVQERFE